MNRKLGSKEPENRLNLINRIGCNSWSSLMKKWILSLCIALSAFAQEEEPTGISKKKPGYATRDATVLSMIGWGITIAVAIATFTALVHNNPAPTTTSSTSTPSS